MKTATTILTGPSPDMLSFRGSKRGNRYAGAAQRANRAGNQHNHGRQSGPALRQRGEQPLRIPGTKTESSRRRRHDAHPKSRIGSFFPEDVIERHRRVDHALFATVAEIHATGTNTRKVQRITEKTIVPRFSGARSAPSPQAETFRA